jgi:hypothetical protein
MSPCARATAKRASVLQSLDAMPNEPEHKEPPRYGVRRPQQQQRRSNTETEELLREQSKTETEQRPYLDTEGGE